MHASYRYFMYTDYINLNGSNNVVSNIIKCERTQNEKIIQPSPGRHHRLYQKTKKLSQQALADLTGMNRSVLSKLEAEEYTPSIAQLEELARVLNFDITDMFQESSNISLEKVSPLKIAVAGTGYVGLSIATLLAQHNPVTAIDIIEEKVQKINNRISPIQDDYIEKYLAEKELDLTCVLNNQVMNESNPAWEIYRAADIVVIAAPTNYDSKKKLF